jgi:hypothetical protein
LAAADTLVPFVALTPLGEGRGRDRHRRDQCQHAEQRHESAHVSSFRGPCRPLRSLCRLAGRVQRSTA